MIDVLFIAPSAAYKLYGDLSSNYSAIEPNIWAAMLAESCRRKGFSVDLVDMEAERLGVVHTPVLIDERNPGLVVFVVTGQNPNASSAAMTGAVPAAEEIKKFHPNLKIAFVGPHVNALPMETLDEPAIDIVLTNEGVYALHNLLASSLSDIDLAKIKGIAYKDVAGVKHINPAERIVRQEDLEIDLPGMALDLLPGYGKYRTSTWHTNFHDELTSPFVSVYTSLGCIFKCEFCMINIINRTDNNLALASDSFNTFRYWEPSHMIKWFDAFAEAGVKNIKIADEMFVLKPKHCVELCKLIIERGYKFNIWAYTRVNTVKEEYLEIFKKAGINWLAIGVESGSQSIREEITKGTFKEVNIRDIISRIRQYDISVGANYIFGLGHDDYETMQETLGLAIELNTENANFYAAAALPGSPLYLKAKQEGWALPNTYSEYGFLSYDCLPSPTYNLSAAQVLKFRDEAFHKYFEGERFLNMIDSKFGPIAVNNIKKLTEIKLKRKIYVQ